MLIDEFLPEYDLHETHEINIRAGEDAVFRAVREANLCESAIVRWLFRLRGLPTENVTLGELKRMRFEILGEHENDEIVLGLAGKFWTVRGGLRKVNSDNFREFDEKGFAKAVWNFSLRRAGNGTCLTTETRIRCNDDASRASFSLYWRLIQPFSALIRNEILKTMKKEAESDRPNRKFRPTEQL